MKLDNRANRLGELSPSTDSDRGEGKRLRVLCVENSEDDDALLIRDLRRGGYDVTYEREETPEAMNATLAGQTWDVVISDYSMLHFSGLSSVALVKNSGVHIPVMIVSGTIGEETAVAAMKAGASDYLMKGNLKRLLPAIERELRDADIRRKRRRAEEENERNWRRIRALHEIDLAIMSTLDMHAVLDIVLIKIDLTLPNSATTVRLINKATGELEPLACRNVGEKKCKAGRRKELTGLAKIVLENKTPIMVSHVQADPRTIAPEFVRTEGLVSYLGVPLIAKNEPLGMMAFYTREPHRFTDDEIEFLMTLAGQAAIGMHNARLYDEIKKHVGELEKANNIKSEFLNVMSHEFRTPLNIIMGYTGALQEGLLGEIKPEQSDALGKVLSHSKDLLSMTNSIFQSTQIEAHTVKLAMTHVDLSSILDSLKSAYEVLLKNRLTLIWDYPSDLPALETDGDKLKHILQNLIDNAIKFTEEGWVKNSVSHLPEQKSVKFQVADTRVGVSEENLPFIFDMFRQVDSSETRAHEGVGLGLYIVKKRTELLGGTVNVESTPGVGSTFTAIFPIQYGNITFNEK